MTNGFSFFGYECNCCPTDVSIYFSINFRIDKRRNEKKYSQIEHKGNEEEEKNDEYEQLIRLKTQLTLWHDEHTVCVKKEKEIESDRNEIPNAKVSMNEACNEET